MAICLALAGMCAAFPGAWADPAQDSAPKDADAISRQMADLIAFLNGGPYAAATSWEEHLVLAYRLARDRTPTPLECVVLRMLRDQLGLKRSDVVSLVLAGDQPGPTWSECRTFLSGVNAASFRADVDVKMLAQSLAATSTAEIMKSLDAHAPGPGQGIDKSGPTDDLPVPDAPFEAYNTYFGYLHAHCRLSDGEGSPIEAYSYARTVGGLDFFSLTDHGELMMFWPWENKWQQLVDAAEATYEPGKYATLWGFEWTNPLLGHINVINSPDFTHVLSVFWLEEFYDWLRRRPEAFGRFNHPGLFDVLNFDFLRLYRFDEAVPQMVGIEMFNGTRGFDVYYYSGSWAADLSYWDVGNRNGWYLGALGGQDNHTANWGSMNEFRTAVLAKDLTREAIIDAYRKRRFYATEDKDLYLDFRCNGYPMGSRIEGVSREFRVAAHDGSGDQFQEVRLYRNGDLLRKQAVTGAAVDVTFADPDASGADYYYVIVTLSNDKDGNGRNDEAISSPIWINHPNVSPAGCSIASTDGRVFHDTAGDIIPLALTACLLLAVGFRDRSRWSKASPLRRELTS
jgi:hypothetical protein